MHATSIMANLRVPDIEAARSFYTGYLGLGTEEFNMGWVARYSSPTTPASLQIVTRDASAAEDSVISVHTDDIEGAYEEAQKLGYEIVHPEEIRVVPRKDLVTPQRGCPEMVDTQPGAEKRDEAESHDLERNSSPRR